MKSFFEHVVDNETFQNIAMVPVILFMTFGGTIFFHVDAKMVRSWFLGCYMEGEDKSIYTLADFVYYRIAANLIWKLCLQRGKEKAMLDLIKFTSKERIAADALRDFVNKKTKYKGTYDKVMLLQ